VCNIVSVEAVLVENCCNSIGDNNRLILVVEHGCGVSGVWSVRFLE